MKFHQVGREKLRQKVSDTCTHKSISLGLQPDLADMAEASTDILTKHTVFGTSRPTLLTEHGL